MSVNAAWPAANEIVAGARPASRTAGRSSTQSSVVLVPMSTTSTPPTTKPATVPSRPRSTFCAGAQRVGAQHRERAEHDPEGVLHAREVGDEHREAEADGAADAVLQPQRVALDVGAGALVRGGERACQPGRLAAEELIEPAAPLGGGGRSRRSPAICETTKLSSCARKLGSSAEITSPLPVTPAGSFRSRCARARRAARAARRAPRAGHRRTAAARPADPRSVRAPGPRRSSRRTARGSAVAACRSGAAWRTSVLSQRSSSTRRTTARAAVLSPVGRYGVAKNTACSASTASSARAIAASRSRRPCAQPGGQRRGTPAIAAPRTGIARRRRPQQRDGEQRRRRRGTPAGQAIGDRGGRRRPARPAG